MGHHKSNKDIRDEDLGQEERRQEIRDEAFEETEGGVADLGSQDERRKDDLPNR